MNKWKSLLISTLIMGNLQAASHYILVGVSGFGTGRDGAGQPSGAHDNLIYRHHALLQTYKLVHKSRNKEINEILENFQCNDGKSARPELGLIIVANSWGSTKGYKLAKKYKKACGKEVEFFYMVDGVTKPIGAFGRKIPAKTCINYYQTKGLVRGKAIKGCENHNLTDRCERNGYGAIQCHIAVEWWGTDFAKSKIYRTLR